MKKNIYWITVLGCALSTTTLASATVADLQQDPAKVTQSASKGDGRLANPSEPGAKNAGEFDRTLRKRGAEAEAAKDFKLAERIYTQLCELNPENPFEHISLARLYDKQNRGREALAAYRIVVKGAPKAYSTLQEDPRVLARYGDLCAQFGQRRQALEAYTKAAAFQDGFYGNDTPIVIPPDHSFNSVRAAAHLGSALANQQVGDDEVAIQEATIAVEASPQWWISRFYRARLFASRQAHKEKARGEFLAAYRLAPAPARLRIAKEGKAWGIFISKPDPAITERYPLGKSVGP